MKIKFGTIDQQGSGHEIITLMTLISFPDIEFEPIFPTKTEDQTIYMYMNDLQHIEEMEEDQEAKLIYMLRDPRDIISNPANNISAEEWYHTFNRLVVLNEKVDFMMLRWEQLVDVPYICQDAICNWLGYTNEYKQHFETALKDLSKLKERKPAVKYGELLEPAINREDYKISPTSGKLWERNQEFADKLRAEIKAFPQIIEVIQWFAYADNNQWVEDL